MNVFLLEEAINLHVPLDNMRVLVLIVSINVYPSCRLARIFSCARMIACVRCVRAWLVYFGYIYSYIQYIYRTRTRAYS